MKADIRTLDLNLLKKLDALLDERRVGLSVSSFLVLPEVLAISDMIAVVPERMAENRPGMFVCETPLPVPGFTKSMAWHGRAHRHPAQAWLRGLLLETSQRA